MAALIADWDYSNGSLGPVCKHCGLGVADHNYLPGAPGYTCIQTPIYANGKIAGHLAPVPAPAKTFYTPGQHIGSCVHCSRGVFSHDVMTGECWPPMQVGTTSNSATWVAPIPADIKAALGPKRKSVAERTCRKCKNKSLREVLKPGEDFTVAFCKYCGTEEEV